MFCRWVSSLAHYIRSMSRLQHPGLHHPLPPMFESPCDVPSHGRTRLTAHFLPYFGKLLQHPCMFCVWCLLFHPFKSCALFNAAPTPGTILCQGQMNFLHDITNLYQMTLWPGSVCSTWCPSLPGFYSSRPGWNSFTPAAQADQKVYCSREGSSSVAGRLTTSQKENANLSTFFF